MIRYETGKKLQPSISYCKPGARPTGLRRLHKGLLQEKEGDILPDLEIHLIQIALAPYSDVGKLKLNMPTS